MTLTAASPQRMMVADTHSLWEFFYEPSSLSPPALQAFRSALAGEATIIVPAIVVAELYYLARKLRQPVTTTRLVNLILSSSGLRISDLTLDQLMLMDVLTDIPEMHDRLIAAEAVLLDAPVITRDGEILAAAGVEYVW